MVVFDADMVAKPNFFTKILEVMLDDDCALCLTPQGFNNVDAQSDIFNNLNLSFWEYMLPGTDALGYIACTGGGGGHWRASARERQQRHPQH